MKNNNERLFVDMHAIQIVPPSNLNRDDTGSPKTAQYGGVKRARVSSQSWKRAMREYFNTEGEISNVGVRTLEIVKYVAEKIIELDNSITMEDAMAKAKDVIEKAQIKLSDNKAKALFFLGDTQAKGLAKAAISGESDKKKIEEILNGNKPIDIALFGRMVADNPVLNEDASSQVAHAISTHGVQTEFDFYTAVDDLAPEDNAGAGMLGTIEFNSSTLYRYANVAIHEFSNQIEDKEAVINAIKLYIKAFVNSMPTGKINTFANQTLPQFVMVTLRKDRPINLISAFEEPVRSSNGYTKASIEKLIKESKKIEKFVEEPALQLFVAFDDVEGLDISGREEENLDALNEELGKYLNDWLV
ncbi:MAG: type I-E CRISPR-associated protein Cas7/Cse4/CasC [Prevotellaceae bacterium]|nr:type I-E CRISPR-associated protein Cas7/Cse4/CasC [Prevotellaceae bacterium]